ncbi:TPA: hypothetical protein DEO28_02110 [Candidatus Dependentiae bacterium]|nr:MAG: hypothetical protein UR14_C0004G0104 [candidate division TM6 bacterium GW2011_GWE2_31_21]KKP53024.1 MAG: hypothetical protein UR43_C0008G0106 [candidate division TM6 bacterium GW2011_GWF2_33_332]HBS47739.1 hypothetical protein [Candidatus Dependentiae bacterium]HBZ73285.1 hypothetical protein [Candidatus Dependentiae bacterium]
MKNVFRKSIIVTCALISMHSSVMFGITEQENRKLLDLQSVVSFIKQGSQELLHRTNLPNNKQSFIHSLTNITDFYFRNEYMSMSFNRFLAFHGEDRELNTEALLKRVTTLTQGILRRISEIEAGPSYHGLAPELVGSLNTVKQEVQASLALER